MENLFAMRASVPPNVLAKEIGGESVLLDLDAGQYFGLDEIGTRMWTVLTGSNTIQSAYDTLLAEYEVDSELLKRDLQELIETLVRQRLLQVT